jgi:hypothetical protein
MQLSCTHAPNRTFIAGNQVLEDQHADRGIALSRLTAGGSLNSGSDTCSTALPTAIFAQ